MAPKTPGSVSPSAEFNRALHTPDPVEAFDGLVRAAEGGCLRAQFLVALAYHTGRGVDRNYALAAQWYRCAAGAGDANSMTNLGVMSLLGQGAPPDDIDAYTWVQSAVGLGHDWLRPALEMLEHSIRGTAETGERARVLAGMAPEEPHFSSCTQSGCDPSRCKVA